MVFGHRFSAFQGFNKWGYNMCNERITKILHTMSNIYSERHNIKQTSFAKYKLMFKNYKKENISLSRFSYKDGFLLIKDCRYIDFLIWFINKFSLPIERIATADNLGTVLRYDIYSDKIHVVFV